MRNRSPFSSLRIISLGFLLTAVILLTLQLIRFSRVRSNLPTGMKIAGIPVGGLDRQEAARRLLEAYSTPVEIRYNGAAIHLDPSTIDFQLDLETMLASADVERTQNPFWVEFWDFLWGRTTSPKDIPLRASWSENRLREYLDQIAQRYDQPSQPPLPIVGTTFFSAGQSGTTLDPNSTVRLVESAITSLVSRELDLPLKRTNPPRPDFRNLEILLKQTLDASDFDGIAGVYLYDLQTGQEVHFGRRNKEDLPIEPGIAFTASSIIKIPIMVSAYRRMDGNTLPEIQKYMADMIEKSGNEHADALMEAVLDPNLGPLVVSDDMQKLGLKNTFLAGEFTFGSPLLQRFDTPANTRTDINTDPDPYSQTTPSEIGTLLADIYECAQTGAGALPVVFPGEIDQTKCQKMITHLINNRLPVLITAGVPEGTQVAHKHGWVSTNGIIHTIGDAGIVYTQGGNYVLVVFLNHPDQLIWESNSELLGRLSQAVYNYYNPPAPASSQ